MMFEFSQVSQFPLSPQLVSVNVVWSRGSVKRAHYNRATLIGMVWGPPTGDQPSAAHRIRTCADQPPWGGHSDFHTPRVITVWKEDVIVRTRTIKRWKWISFLPLCLAAYWVIYLLMPISHFAQVRQTNLPLFTNSPDDSPPMLESSQCVLLPSCITLTCAGCVCMQGRNTFRIAVCV